MFLCSRFPLFSTEKSDANSNLGDLWRFDLATYGWSMLHDTEYISALNKHRPAPMLPTVNQRNDMVKSGEQQDRLPSSVQLTPGPRGYYGLAAVHDQLFLFGGARCEPGCVCNSELWSFDPSSACSWTLLTYSSNSFCSCSYTGRRGMIHQTHERAAGEDVHDYDHAHYPLHRYKHSLHAVASFPSTAATEAISLSPSASTGVGVDVELFVFGGESFSPSFYYNDVFSARLSFNVTHTPRAVWSALPTGSGGVERDGTGGMVDDVVLQCARTLDPTTTATSLSHAVSFVLPHPTTAFLRAPNPSVNTYRYQRRKDDTATPPTDDQEEMAASAPDSTNKEHSSQRLHMPVSPIASVDESTANALYVLLAVLLVGVGLVLRRRARTTRPVHVD